MKLKVLLFLVLIFVVIGIAPAQDQKGKTVSVSSKFPLKLHGFLKFDMAWDDSRIHPGNYASWVKNEATTKDDSELNVTGNQSRFGIDIGGPESRWIKTGAKIELDFHGGGAENKANPQMRHAYLWAEWEKHNLKLVAGQAWDLVGSLNFPAKVDYNPLWYCGNIGYRHPQLSIHQAIELENELTVNWGAGLFRTIGTDSGFGPGDSGEDADFPTVQARVAMTMPFLAGKAMFALSGHYGTEEYDTAANDVNTDYDSYSLCFDFKFHLHKNIKLNGCYFIGENIDDIFGGIGQGVNVASSRGIASRGGFINLSIVGLVPDWDFNFGYGMENPDNTDLNAGDRGKNSSFYANSMFSITRNLTFCLEVSSWETEYVGAATKADALRFQTALLYKF